MCSLTMVYNHWFYLLIFYALCPCILTGNGHPCYLGYYEQGICTSPRNCPAFRRGLVDDTAFFPCNFHRRRPMICCPTNNGGSPYYEYDSSEESNENSRRRGGNGHNRNRPGGRRRPPWRQDSEENTESIPTSGISIVDKKCEEYRKKPEVKALEPGVFRPFVVGGVDTAEKEFPHMVALGFGQKGEEQWLCGGSLISERYILTAAHCLNTQDLGEVKWARMGVSNIKTVDSSQVQDFEIVSRLRHPEYRPPLQYNDIGLVMIDRDAIFSDYVRPVCLQTISDLNDTIPIATGWGRTQYGGSSSDTLKKVEISYFSLQDCRETYANASPRRLPNGIVDESQICAGSATEEKDTCQGDSGGPLQVKNTKYENTYNIIGITSFGTACGIVNSPGVYTRVSNYVKWIQEVVWP